MVFAGAATLSGARGRRRSALLSPTINIIITHVFQNHGEVLGPKYENQNIRRSQRSFADGVRRSRFPFSPIAG